MKIDITKKQLKVLCDIIDEYHASLGGGDDDDIREKWVEHIDKMLVKNNKKRNYKMTTDKS